MARIPRSVIDAYTRELNSISDENRRGLEDALGRVDWDAPVAVVREQLVAAMQMWCGGATDQAAMLASVFYDGVREIAVGEPMGAFAESHREPDRTTRAVRAFVQDLVDGKGPEPVRRKCLERLDYEVKRAAAECVDANARRDRKRPRYARVPSGSETCDFCIMLASRGPVYHSERSAGALDHFHANCDCRVVPMWDTYYVGPSRMATASSPVEGYDPDELYERYIEFMTDGKFRDRMARAADRAKGGDGDDSGRETSHPMLWAKTKREGLVTLGSAKEVQDYIRDATSYEDLFERIDLVSNEWVHYGLSDSYRQMVQQTMRNTRDRLLGVKGNYPSNQSELAGNAEHAKRRESGGTFGAWNSTNDPDGVKRQQHADRYYKELRNRDEDSEVLRVSANTGIGDAVVRQAYRHIFIERHELGEGLAHFDPDYDMSQSWQRLSTGVSIQPHDYTLIYHEAIEDDFMYLTGLSYTEAHAATCDMGYDWFKQCNEWKIANGLM